jgi:hypothetical protein
MADQLLKAWGARPTVASVSLHTSEREAVVKSAEYTRVSDLRDDGSTLSWTEIDEALPLPFNQWEPMWSSGPIALVLKSSDVTQELNQEPLTVTGLRSGVYSIKIDGETVATVNDEELARGVNLALLKTPMTEQAKKVYDLTVSHCDIHNQRWRTIQVPLASETLPQVAPAMAAADALEQAVLEKRRQVAQPASHHFEIVAVK